MAAFLDLRGRLLDLPYWPAFGRREILERLDLSVVLMDVIFQMLEPNKGFGPKRCLDSRFMTLQSRMHVIR